MIKWTESARRLLNEYCARSKSVLAGSGVDVDEVSDDLKRHVEQEAFAAHLSIVTEEDVRRILARVGEPAVAGEAAGRSGPAEPPAAAPAAARKRPGFILLIFGVVLPLGTLILELATGVSAGLLFDPLPTWFHVAMVALVPAANFWIWRAARAQDSRPARQLGWLNAVAFGISIFYSIAYLLFAPMATFAVVFFGAGLIPLAPYFAAVATPLLRAAYARQNGRDRLPGRWGVLLGFAALVVLQVPTASTYYGLAKVASADTAGQAAGIRVLRMFGDHELMLRACYGLLARPMAFDLVRRLASGNALVLPEEARASYYRVTGRPFNSVPPPALYTRVGRWTGLDEEFTWDDALGGENVAGQVKGLSLLSSRMDAVAEPDSAVVYCEWTLEFKNVSSLQREARAQIALPPGAVVSRLTLWINGEEREAAFGGRSQVREAYQEVAVVQRRDPVLVTTCGPDRVLMQCFPVPPNGGVMKVRLGVAAPLFLDSTARGRFVWPYLLERNFRIASDLKHALWMQSPAPLQGSNGSILTNAAAGAGFTLRAVMNDRDFSGTVRAVTVDRSPDVLSVWSRADEGGSSIRQTIEPAPAEPPSRLIVVVDGSVGMRRYLAEVLDALSNVPSATEIAVLMADDTPRLLSNPPRKLSSPDLKAIGEKLRAAGFEGGQDNVPALEQACALAAGGQRSAVLWIHQPQPVLLSPESALRQQLERAPDAVQLFELQTEPGPDRIVEKLDGVGAVRHLPRFGSVESDLNALLARWAGRSPTFKLVRDEVASSSLPTNGRRGSSHIVALWARDEAARLAARRDREGAVKLAAGHQIVTPLTGAVVLQTQEQFTQHGLKPADPQTVPAVPEPQAAILLLLGMGALLARRRFRR